MPLCEEYLLYTALSRALGHTGTGKGPWLSLPAVGQVAAVSECHQAQPAVTESPCAA